MKRYYAGILVGAAFLVLGVSGMFAGTAKSTVKIPFAFAVEADHFPPGQYEFFEEAGATNRLRMRNLDTKETIYLTVVTRISRSNGNESRIVFDKAGDERFLAEIHFAGEDGYQLKGAAAGPHTHVSVDAGK